MVTTMTPPTDEERAFTQQILDRLATSPYACSSLSRLTGGTANFLYRGTLHQPLPFPDARTVIVKCSTEYVAINRDFPLDVRRCVFENAMLKALAGFPRTISTTLNGDKDNDNNDVEVRVPQVLFFDEETHLQVLQDFPDTRDLTAFLNSPSVDQILPSAGPGPISIGRALGSWLRMFHDWVSEPAQDGLLVRVGGNNGMRTLKCRITYDSFVEILERYPELIEGHRDTLRDVRHAVRYEFERAPVKGDEVRGLIHGDFWGGK